MFDLISLFSLFGGQNGFMQKLAAFSQQFSQQSQITPEQKVQQLLDSGQMTQQQFNTFSQVANQLTGRRF